MGVPSVNGHGREELLAAPAWLADVVDDSAVRVIDCGPPEGYRRGHVPGAVRLPVHPWIKDGELNSVGVGRRLTSSLPMPVFTPDDGDRWKHVLPGARFAEVMGALGVGDGTTVVCYDDAGGPYAARLWWVLRLYGHRNAKVLDGGWRRWVGEGHAISFDEPAYAPARMTPVFDATVLSLVDELLSGLGDARVRVIDTRTDAEWSGADNFGNSRVGHVPGAVHLEWLRFLTEDGRTSLRPVPEMRALLAAAGVSRELHVVTYCQAGIRGAFVAFVLTLLGWDHVSVYDGSMLEWANRDDTPLEVEVG